MQLLQWSSPLQGVGGPGQPPVATVSCARASGQLVQPFGILLPALRGRHEPQRLGLPRWESLALLKREASMDF